MPAELLAPAVAAKALGSGAPELTIGNDAATAAGLEKLGARHVDHPVTGIHIDAAKKIVTTPAYMYDASIDQVAFGIRAMVNEVIGMLE